MIEVPPSKRLSASAERRARTLADRLDPEVFESILHYGLSAQVRLAGIADEVMTRLESGANERIALVQLIERLKRLDPARNPDRGLFGLPMLGRGAGAEDRLLDRYDRLRYRLDRLMPQLEAACRQLGQTLGQFDRLHERNETYLEELEILILGARLRVDDMQRELLPAMMQKAGGVPVQAERLELLSRHTERLEQRLNDLENAAETARQTGPTIRRIQDELRGLILDAQQTAFSTATRWKQRFADAVTRVRRGSDTADLLQPDAAAAPPATNRLLRRMGLAQTVEALRSKRERVRRWLSLRTEFGTSTLWWG